jgi:hypothetical protein
MTISRGELYLWAAVALALFGDVLIELIALIVEAL